MLENVLRVIRGVKSVHHAYPIVTNLIDLKKSNYIKSPSVY